MSAPLFEARAIVRAQVTIAAAARDNGAGASLNHRGSSSASIGKGHTAGREQQPLGLHVSAEFRPAPWPHAGTIRLSELSRGEMTPVSGLRSFERRALVVRFAETPVI